MSGIYDFLLERAAHQLDKLTPKVNDGTWLDSLLEKLEDQVTSANLDETVLNASMEGIAILKEHKSTLVGLGSHAFGLLLLQISSGRDEEAIKTYIRALTNADDIIALMNSGTDGVIKAKMELDALHAKAKKLTMELLTAGIRFLIPFILSLI